MKPVLLVVGSFVVMEAISYGLHRWVMHRVGMRWHASHHRPPAPGWEANDVFPGVFSIIGITVFALASTGPRIEAFWWVGVGVAMYGLAYLFVHDVYIHRRLPVRIPRLAYLEWLKRSHRLHHTTGAEPYGMLLPVLSRSSRSGNDPVSSGVAEGSSPDDDVLDRGVAARDSTRPTRQRL